MKKILLIEDEPDLVTVLQTRLEANNYQVATALDGEEGLAKVEQEAPDLILLDIIMPKIDGLEVCQRIKSNQKTAHIPVIIITASGVKDVDKKSAEAGAQYLIRKPFDPTDLLKKIRTLIGE